MATKIYEAVILSVVDGDTYDAIVDLGFNISLKIRIRLHGVNCPELKSNDPDIKANGISAKVFVEKILKNPVKISVHRMDPYGRWESDVLFGGMDLATLLLDAKKAVKVPGY
jgi:micrococcal nuclease